MPASVDAAELEAVVARWTQGVRYSLVLGADSVRVLAARGLVINASVSLVANAITGAVTP